MSHAPGPGRAGEAGPVIIVKKHKGHDAHHGGAWKVAYADFVTAMMAFFMVLWLINQTEQVKQAVGGYFRDPAGFSERAGARAMKGGDGVMDGSEGPVPGDPVLEGTELRAEPEIRPEVVEPEQLEQMLRTADEIRRALAEDEEFADIADRVEVTVTAEGLRIELMESDRETFFRSGGADLSPGGREVLQVIGAKLASLDRAVVVEGHTDSVPYSGRNADYTNWDLSAARANAARRVLEASGVAHQHIAEVRGYAARRPRFPDPRDPRNRRVAILVPHRAV